MEEEKKIKITESQRNSISSVLLILNEVIDEIEDLCTTGDKKSILYEVVNNLNDREKSRVFEATGRIKESIQDIAKTLNIKKKRYEIKNLISSRIASLWEIVYEIESKRLKGYGEVSKTLKEYLDPEVTKITQLLEGIEEILYRKK
ncbi:MAG TPA: hypothetical protein PLQ41_02165 [bacterium]|nr:hypothetical protein [bacterium]HPP30521.1 hypothetical protein [bacterium]